MKNLKEELKNLAEKWSSSGEYDGTEFEGRHFITDADLDEFAQENGLTEDDGESFDEAKLQINCDCQIIYDYDGANPNRQFGDSEIIFNETEQENEMKNLKTDFQKICIWWVEISEDAAAEYERQGGYEELLKWGGYETDADDADVTGVYLNDDDFDDFTDEHGLTIWQDDEKEFRDHPATLKAVEKICDCKIVWDESRKCETVIFNNKTEQENEMEEEKVFGRKNADGNIDLLHWETGEAVTRYPGCWPLDSELSGAYEHPAGIKLSVEDAEELGIEIEA
jgi:hypothetical protein